MTDRSPQDSFAGPYLVQPTAASIARLALGTSCTISTLLCIPDGFGILPDVPNASVWFLRMIGLWLSAFILWGFSFQALLYTMRFLTRGVELQSTGIKLWRFGKLIPWTSIKAVSCERQPFFSKMFNLRPDAYRLTLYVEKAGKGGPQLVSQHIPSFQFPFDSFVSLLIVISENAFCLKPNAVELLIAEQASRTELKKNYERGKILRVALSALILLGLVSFLARKAGLNYYFNSGNREFRQEHYVKSAADYATATKVDPTFAPAWDMLARSEFRLGKSAEAEEHWHKALFMKPDLAESKIGLANLLVRRRDFSAAKKLLEQAVRLAPMNAAGYVSLADLYNRAANFNESARVADLVLARDPDNVRVATIKARALLHLGRLDEASAVIARVRHGHAAIAPYDLSLCELVEAEIALTNGDIEVARTTMAQLRPRFSNSGELLLDDIRLKILQKKYDDAGQLIQLARKQDGDNPWPILLQAEILASQNQHESAKTSLREALKCSAQDLESLRLCESLFKDEHDVNGQHEAASRAEELRRLI